MEKERGEHRVFRVRIDESGRIVLPAEIRSGLGMSAGDTLTIVNEPAGLRVATQAQALRAVQDYFRSIVPEGVRLVDELIAERRAEAERE